MNTITTDLPKIMKLVVMREFHNLNNKIFPPSVKDKEYLKFHSQFGEDRYIFEHINLPEKGTFVDVGAGHPIYLSNTYFFEKNGWNGICIDADPTQVELLRKERKNVEWAAISLEEGEIEFSQAISPEYSSTLSKEKYHGIINIPFKDTISVPSYRLETLLEKNNIGIIDILDIDVEGTELEVWKTFDYTKHKPKVVIIEYYTFGVADNSKKILNFFADLPYQLVHTTCTNFIFCHLPL